MQSDFNFNYGHLFEEELSKEILSVGEYKKVAEGTELIDIGSKIEFMPLIINGAIKILREDEKGDELVLYFIEQGDTCAMTITCCLGQSKSKIRAVAEVETELIMIPVQKISEWMNTYQTWQNFILQSYHERMQELLEAIDTIAFLNMDKRLLKYLKDKAMINRNEVIQVTHKEIANDLYTSRVVISRLLKSLEIKGKIQLNRNQIKVLSL
ncbi:Global nitrogen regulator [Polaribacter huanghezhanensis]|uniref:Crp/Fnr family transcriptional regulator n=1 Tax=Polaribacter huanghezhanensis TaxID=1354726 RepID=UPI0026495F7D|nr:Crp/Fnr family transcriptional regulator [Polaribacter huanghezhanensis]WKD85530.1 Global nitrogen regulator [Polaribacter huanghezhanensis]